MALPPPMWDAPQETPASQPNPTIGTSFFGIGSSGISNVSEGRLQRLQIAEKKAFVAPVPETYKCRPCEKEFKIKSQLVAHITTHVKCDYCAFTASKKMVSLHAATAHPATIKKVVPPGDSPEEIAQWIADRKKRYPTAENMKRKEEEVAKKRAAADASKKAKRLKALEEGTSLVDYEDSEEEQEAQDPKKKGKKKINKTCKFFLKDGSCKRGDACKFKHLPNDETRVKPKKKQPFKNAAPVAEDSLLKKLLATDIAKEQSILLQCIRYLSIQDDRRKASVHVGWGEYFEAGEL